MADQQGRFGERDELVRPPSFHDGIARTPLQVERAAWHGAQSRTVSLAVGIAGLGAIVAIAFMVLAAPAVGPLEPTGSVAAQGASASDGPAAPATQAVTSITQGPVGNLTSSPLPLPP